MGLYIYNKNNQSCQIETAEGEWNRLIIRKHCIRSFQCCLSCLKDSILSFLLKGFMKIADVDELMSFLLIPSFLGHDILHR